MAARYIVLSGGVGGAKLVRGLQQILSPDDLLVIANTGDDFEHLGLPISPDLDTLMYSLAGIANPDQGWGLVDESWNFMTMLEKLGGDTWFRLGDRDLATHLRRRQLLKQGHSLSAVSAVLCEELDIAIPIVPMSDQPVRTQLETSAGNLGFQDYFVRLQAEPEVSKISYVGSETALVSPPIEMALEGQELRGIIISPSNPWLSIAPILSIPRLKQMIIEASVPVIAVSPVVGGEAIKGPTAKIMRELSMEPSVTSIAQHYQELVTGLIFDNCDAAERSYIENLGLAAMLTNTIMRSDADKKALAQDCIAFIDSLTNAI